MTWTIAKLIDWAAEYFSQKGIDSSRLDAELLLAHALGLNRVGLYVQYDRPLNETELAKFKALVQRRAQREPLAYISGQKEFFSLPFQVGSEVLIPRPETEELVELGLKHLQKLLCDNVLPEPRILDLATGSGCILISLLHQLEKSSGIGLDLSQPALARAATNANALQVESRATWLQADLREDWPKKTQGPFDLITANLPYVSEQDWQQLQAEVRDFEPKQALVPGVEPTPVIPVPDQSLGQAAAGIQSQSKSLDPRVKPEDDRISAKIFLPGTEAFAWIFPHLTDLLAPHGLAIFEFGLGQEKFLQAQAAQLCPTLKVEIVPDLSRRPRFLTLLSSITLPPSSRA